MRRLSLLLLVAAASLALVCCAVAQQEEEVQAASVSLRGLLGDSEITDKPGLVTEKPTEGSQASDKVGSSCKDRYKSCGYWKKKGYCASKWTYQYKSISKYWCPYTCGTCCYNYLSDSQCKHWRNYCYKYQGKYYYFKGYTVDSWCPYTCGRC